MGHFYCINLLTGMFLGGNSRTALRSSNVFCYKEN